MLYETYQLLLEYSNLSQIEEFVDIGSNLNISHSKIGFNSKECNNFLGSNITNNKFSEIFQLLDFRTKDLGKNNFKISVPIYRNDLMNEIDLYEEVARVYGYDNIPNSKIAQVSYNSLKDDNEKLMDKVRNFLSLNGYNEHISNSLIHEEEAKIISNMSNLNVSGIMMIPPYRKIDNIYRDYHKRTKELQEKIYQGGVSSFIDISMGMSRDYKLAIKEGATHIRLGSILFGPRNTL